MSHHTPIVTKEQEILPPFIVAIVGPPKSGKSTVLSSLIKYYTKSPVSQINGPITVISGKRRRLTFIECNNDINSMTDISKIADLVLLIINSKNGLQMEIFEFLSMIQVSGFPRVMGVLTFLDKFKENKSLNVYKKKIKQRFWTDVYPGAKVFYLTGFKYSSYGKREIINLARFISLAKSPQILWRTTHPYILCDRMEDITNEEKIRSSGNNCDRNIALYGYIQGTHLKKTDKIHIMGVGDYDISKINFLSDPCPFPDNFKNRRLDAKERLVYAPFSSINNILFDKDAVYIDVGQSKMFQENSNQNNDLNVEDLTPADNLYVSAMLDMKYTVKDKLKASFFKLIDDIEFEDGNSTDDENSNKSSDISNDEIVEQEFDTKIYSERIKNSHQNLQLHLPHVILKHLIYGRHDQDTVVEKKIETSEKLVGDLFFQKPNNSLIFKSSFDNSIYDCTRTSNKYDPSELLKKRINWLDVENTKSLIYKFFVTGQSANLDENIRIIDEALENNYDKNQEDEIYGDFDDLEKSEKNVSNNNIDDSNDNIDDSSDDKDDSSDNKDDSNDNKDNSNNVNKIKNLNEKKLLKKQKFDIEYDSHNLKQSKKSKNKNLNGKNYTNEDKYFNNLKKQAIEQKILDDNEFKDLPDEQRVLYEGFRPGMYVRIEISNMDNEFVTNFDPRYPLIIGGLLPNEDQFGYINLRIKKHKWYKRILKNNDPVIISIGWRRFQSIACFSMEDHNKRKRFIKYTPSHLHCYATCYGPIINPGVGVFTLQVPPYIRKSEFRVTSTGVTIENDKTTSVVKKLKLIGTPYKIFKNTAFIKGMFSNALEVTKFEGAKLVTVSGIRGHLKKAESSNDGNFRATFEDKILMSDIVFLRTWIPVEIPKFYNPIKTLLMSPSTRLDWIGMKTVGTLRYENNLPYPHKPDSDYKKIERIPKVFAPLVIPEKLQKELPFKSKPKIIVKAANLPSNSKIIGRVLEPQEKKAVTLMKEILLTNKDLNMKRTQKRRLELKEFQLKKAKNEQERMKKIKNNKAMRYALNK